MNKRRLAALAMAGLMATQLTGMAFAEDITEPVLANKQEKVVEGNVTVKENRDAHNAVSAVRSGSVDVTGDVSYEGANPDRSIVVNASGLLDNKTGTYTGSSVEIGGNVTGQADANIDGAKANGNSTITIVGDVSITAVSSETSGVYDSIGVVACDGSEVTVGGNVTAEAKIADNAIGVNAFNDSDVSVTGDVTASGDGISVGIVEQYANSDTYPDPNVDSRCNVTVGGDVNAGGNGIMIGGTNNTVQVAGDVNAEGNCGVEIYWVTSDSVEGQNNVEIGGSVSGGSEGVSVYSDSAVAVMGSVIGEDIGIYVNEDAGSSVIVVAGDVTTTSETGKAVRMFGGSALIGGDATGDVTIGSDSDVNVAVGGTIDGELIVNENSAVYANNVTGDVILEGKIDTMEIVLGERKDIYVNTDETPSLVDYDEVKGVVKYLLDLGADKGNVNVETKVEDYITEILALSYDDDNEAQQTAIDKIVEKNGVLANENGEVSGIYLNDDAKEDLTITVEAKEGADLKGLAMIDAKTGAVTPLTSDEDGVYTITQEMVKQLLAGKLTLNVDCKLIANEDGTYRVVKAEKTGTTQKTEQTAQALAINNEIEDGAFVIPEAVAGEAVELAIPKTGAASAEEVLEVTLKKVEKQPKVGATSLGKNEEAEITAEDYTVNEDGTITLGA